MCRGLGPRTARRAWRGWRHLARSRQGCKNAGASGTGGSARSGRGGSTSSPRRRQGCITLNPNHTRPCRLYRNLPPCHPTARALASPGVAECGACCYLASDDGVSALGVRQRQAATRAQQAAATGDARDGLLIGHAVCGAILQRAKGRGGGGGGEVRRRAAAQVVCQGWGFAAAPGGPCCPHTTVAPTATSTTPHHRTWPTGHLVQVAAPEPEYSPAGLPEGARSGWAQDGSHGIKHAETEAALRSWRGGGSATARPAYGPDARPRLPSRGTDHSSHFLVTSLRRVPGWQGWQRCDTGSYSMPTSAARHGSPEFRRAVSQTAQARGAARGNATGTLEGHGKRRSGGAACAQAGLGDALEYLARKQSVSRAGMLHWMAPP